MLWKALANNGSVQIGAVLILIGNEPRAVRGDSLALEFPNNKRTTLKVTDHSSKQLTMEDAEGQSWICEWLSPDDDRTDRVATELDQEHWLVSSAG